MSNDSMPLNVKLLLMVAVIGAPALADFPRLAAGGEPVVPDFWNLEPLPALWDAAAEAGIKLGGISYDTEHVGLAAGDRVAVLVEELDGEKRRQWLIELVCKAANDEPAAPASELRLYTSTGNEITFSGERTSLAIHVLGPVAEAGRGGGRSRPLKDVWSGALVTGEYSQLGFARGEQANRRIHEKNAARGEGTAPLHFSFSSEPTASDEVAVNRARAAERGMTAEDERVFAGTLPALLEFFQVGMRTPGLNEIMRAIIDIPVWSIVMRGGRMPAVSFDRVPLTNAIDAGQFGLPGSGEAFEVVEILKLNGHPALCFRMFVVEPHPPLVASAGIVALVAGKPDGKGPRMMLRVVAARREIAVDPSLSGDKN